MLIFHIQALSIKCFTNGTTSGKATSTTCATTPTALTTCARVGTTTNGNLVRAYLCVDATTVTAANTAGFPTVTDSLVCKNVTLTASGTSVTTEYCFCKAEDCNDPAKGATTAVDLMVSIMAVEITRHLIAFCFR